MRKSLHLGSNLTLPLDVVSRATAIVGQRGTGKTSTAVVMGEEADVAGAHFCVWDPTGAWYGLRSNAEGDGPGLPVVVIGGHHADIPLEETSGKLIAELIVHEGYNVVIDSELLSKSAQARLGADFFETLYHINREALMVIVDEAHRPAPQQMRENNPFAARCLGGLIDCVTLGRRKGLGVVVVTQRLSRLHKDVLEGCEIMLAHRLMGANDRKAIKEWLADAARDENEAKEVLGSIGKLGLGELIAYAPTLDLYGRFTIRPKRTFDSSATPTIGAKVRAAPTARAEIDLDALRGRMAKTLERAKADDPAELRKRIRELEKMIGEQGERTPEKVEVDVPVLVDEDAQRLLDGSRAVLQAVENFGSSMMSVLGPIRESADRVVEAVESVRTPEAASSKPHREAIAPQSHRTPPTRRLSSPPRASVESSNGDLQLGKAHRLILTVLANHPDGRSKRALALETGYSHKGGAFNNPLGRLRTAGYINRGDPIQVTVEGLEALGPIDPLPRGQELLEHWQNATGKAGRLILGELALEPDGLAKEELASRCGYEPGGGAFNNPLGKLRTLGLVAKGNPISLTPEFAEAIA